MCEYPWMINQKQPMNQQELHNQQNVAEEHHCAICLCVYYKPLRLVKCKHVFCENCIHEASLIVQNQRCPLCRMSFTENQIVPEPELWDQMQKRYPNHIHERKLIIKERIYARFLIGNKTEFLQTNDHNKFMWTFYIRPAPGDHHLSHTIQKIDIKLDSTFSPCHLSFPISENMTVQLARLGWGTFRIGIEIFWKDLYQQTKSDIYHDLQFVPLAEKIVHTTLTLK